MMMSTFSSVGLVHPRGLLHSCHPRTMASSRDDVDGFSFAAKTAFFAARPCAELSNAACRSAAAAAARARASAASLCSVWHIAAVP
jgi:hypothetical protein